MSVAKTITLIEPLDAGLPGPEHFRIVETPVPTTLENDGDIIVQALVFSADPYMRGQIKTGRGMVAGGTMKGFIAGKVLKSRNANWVEGDLFGASLPLSTVQVVSGDALTKTMIWKLTEFIDESQISLGVGVLGMPGSTAYGGLIDVLRPNKGETIFVSAASGAVGGLVGQIAKTQYNCTVVGSAGGAEKGTILKEKFGFDHAIDYKTVDDAAGLIGKLKEAVPDGIDMYFENVGGIHWDAALATLRPHGRVAVCGCISGYNDALPKPNELFIGQMIYTFQRIEGFMCAPWLTGKKGNFLKDMSAWLKEGHLKIEETFFDGIEQWPAGFQSLFTGANKGKVVVRVA